MKFIPLYLKSVILSSITKKVKGKKVTSFSKLKADKSNVKVWEEVTFEVISDVFSHADDFEENRVIEIDFEWDGEYDLTTNNNIIKHTYYVASPTAYPYRPEASVIYNDYKWHWEWKPIIVKI